MNPAEKLDLLQRCAQVAHQLLQLGDPAAETLALGFRAGLKSLHDRWGASPEFAPLLAERTAERQRRQAGDIAREGPALWAEWHTRAHLPVTDPPAEHRWLAAFALRLPKGDCQCRTHFNAWLAAFLAPPDPYADYFAATVECHNAVNARKKKPLFSLEEALARWPAPAA